MAENVKTRILLRSDIASAWTAANPVLLKGEVGIEYNPAVAPAEGRVIKIKIGDGTTAWNALGYVADYDASITAINEQITTLNGADNVTGSVSQKIKAAIDGLASVYQEKLPEGAATGKYLTADASGNLIWKAVADPTWANITGNIADNEALAAELNKKQNVISDTNKLGAALVEETADKKFVSQAEKEKIAKVDTIETSLGNYVEKETGKSLISDDAITKLGGIEAGAQVNAIEGIQVDGVDVAVGEGKKVNITGLATDANLTAAVARITAIEGKEEGWNDKYTQAATDELLKAKANAADVYAKTETYSRTEIDGKIAEIHKWSYSIVETIPTVETAEEFVIYLVKDTSGNYKEYIKVNTGSAEAPAYVIEQLGDFHVDLSNYYTKDDVNAELAKKQDKLTAGDGVVIDANNKISINVQAATKVYQVEIAAGAEHLGAINTAVGENVKNTGDVAIVKEAIGDTTQKQYCAYVFDGENWVAMDGNYNAENVYFAEDLTYTKQIGELPAVPASGAATLSAKGKNIKTVLSSILAQRKQPSVNNPTVTLSGTQGNLEREIGTTITVSGKTLGASLSAGSYTYGPATGVTATAWSTKVSYTQGKTGEIATGETNSLPYEYNFQLGTDGNTVAVKFEATATHGAGAVAKDNLGDNSNPVKQVAAGTKTQTSTAIYSSYRKMFYGTRVDATELDSIKIRELIGVKDAAYANNSLSVNIPTGAKRVVIAVPGSREVTSVKDVNDSSAEIISAFEKQVVAVEGAEKYTAINYNVYICDYANPATAVNTYKVTIK